MKIKKRGKKNREHKKISKSTIIEVILTILNIASLLLALILLIFVTHSEKPANPVYNVKYDSGSTESAYQQKTMDWLDSLDNIYLSLVKNITFTTDDSIFEKYNENLLYKTIGLNKNGKDIYVLIGDDDAESKMVLCHELLHSFVNLDNSDLEENIVDNLARKGVCFTR